MLPKREVRSQREQTRVTKGLITHAREPVFYPKGNGIVTKWIYFSPRITWYVLDTSFSPIMLEFSQNCLLRKLIFSLFQMMKLTHIYSRNFRKCAKASSIIEKKNYTKPLLAELTINNFWEHILPVFFFSYPYFKIAEITSIW